MALKSFREIEARAAARHGGPAAIEAGLPALKTASELARVGDDRWLSMISRRVFQAGFNWKVIDNKWPGFEEAFEGFPPGRWALMSDDDLDRLLADTRIVRHAKKILSVGENARFLCDLAAEHGSAAKCFADWPEDDLVGLLDLMKRRGARLGGTTAQYILRSMGRDGFVLGRDVVAALIDAGAISKPPGGKRDMAAVQAAFNQWREETGRPFAHLSRILGLSIDADS